MTNATTQIKGKKSTEFCGLRLSHPLVFLFTLRFDPTDESLRTKFLLIKFEEFKTCKISLQNQSRYKSSV